MSMMITDNIEQVLACPDFHKTLVSITLHLSTESVWRVHSSLCCCPTSFLSELPSPTPKAVASAGALATVGVLGFSCLCSYSDTQAQHFRT